MGDDDFFVGFANETDCIQLDEYLVSTTDDITGDFSFRCVFISLYTLVFLLGFSGNWAVVLLISCQRQLRSVRNVFIANLALADILVCITSLPISAFTLMYKQWVFGSWLCSVIPLCQGTSIFVGIFTLAAIAVDRFILICRPHKIPINGRQALVTTVAIWLCGVLITLPMALSHRLIAMGYDYESDRRFCGKDCQEHWESDFAGRLYGVVVWLLQFLAPMCVISGCYACIIRFVSAVHLRQLGHVRVLEAKRCRKRRRTNAILIAMVCLFVALWAPHVVLGNLLIDTGFLPTQYHYIWSLLAHFLAMTSNIANPLLYAYANGNFKNVWQTQRQIILISPKRKECLLKPTDISNSKVVVGVTNDIVVDKDN